MNIFKKQIMTKCCLIKKVEMTKDGWQTSYYTTVNDLYISNSEFDIKEKAELFFEKTLENKGVVKRKEVIKTEYV